MNKPELIKLTHRIIFNTPAYVINGEFDKNGKNTVNLGTIDTNYIGAEYITLFYNRNLKIYSNILNLQLTHQPKKMLLIIGQLHVGVLKDLVEENPNFSLVKCYGKITGKFIYTCFLLYFDE